MYGTIAGWTAYATARGVNDPAITEADLPALVRGSDYVKYHYVANFRPAFDDTLVEVEMAAYEAALVERATPGFFQRTYSPSDAKVLVAVDSLRWEKVTSSRTDDLDNNQVTPVSTKVEMYLRPYMRFKHEVGIRSVGG